ncbi:MAG: membrane lipoprotein lipid attachment site-containing protein [Bacilli bacterium]
MKKILIVFFSIFLLTGCTFVNIEKDSVEDIINTVIEKDIDLYNNVFEGYKLYVPRGLKIVDKNQYNSKILFKDDTLYLYVDVVSYYYKTKKTFTSSTTNYLSKELRFNDKLGYIDITETEDKYFVEFMYNYAKIEAYVEKKYLNESVLNMAYILSSIQYNEKVINTLIGENVLDYQEEKYDIFESKRENSNFLDWIEKYDTFVEDEKEKNQDVLDYEVVE